MGKMIPASAPWCVGSSACRIEVQMSDFHTWNALQEDTTGRSAYTEAAPHRMGMASLVRMFMAYFRLDLPCLIARSPLERIAIPVC